jgi:chromosome segregation ATPase
MSDEVTQLAARVDAVERALSDGETGLDDIEDLAALDARLTELESTAGALETRVGELEAAVEAVRGFAGGIRAVNREVEQRADLALAKVEAIESDRRDGDATARPPDGEQARHPRAGGSGSAGEAGLEAEPPESRPGENREGSPDGPGLAERLRELL